MFSTIGIVVDIVLVALVLIFAIVGYVKGFLKSFLSLFSWAVCLIVAFVTAKYIAGWINGIYDFSALIGGKIASAFAGMNDMFAQPINSFANAEDIITNIPEGTNGILVQLIKIVLSNASLDMTSTDTIANMIGMGLGNICMVIISGILVFIVLKIILGLLSKLFDNIARIKVLGVLNKILGLTFGAIKAFAVVIVLNVILVFLSLVPIVNNTITPLITENTYVEKFVYEKTDDIIGKYVIEGNLLQNWITGLWNSR